MIDRAKPMFPGMFSLDSELHITSVYHVTTRALYYNKLPGSHPSQIPYPLVHGRA